MEKYQEIIPIFFAVDDKYVPFLAVTLQSLVNNASQEYYYVIKVLYTRMSEESKEKINKYTRENISIEYVDLNYLKETENKNIKRLSQIDKFNKRFNK